MFKQVSSAVALLGFYAGSAMAALPTGVDDAVEAAGADGVTLVGLVAIGGAGVYLIKRVLSRFGITL